MLLLLLLLLLLVAVVVDVVDVVDDLEALARRVFDWRLLSDLMLLLLLGHRNLRRDGHDVVVGALQDRLDRLVAVGLRRGQVKIFLDEVRRCRPVAKCVLKDDVTLPVIVTLTSSYSPLMLGFCA